MSWKEPFGDPGSGHSGEEAACPKAQRQNGAGPECKQATVGLGTREGEGGQRGQREPTMQPKGSMAGVRFFFFLSSFCLVQRGVRKGFQAGE